MCGKVRRYVCGMCWRSLYVMRYICYQYELCNIIVGWCLHNDAKADIL
jgi:hypothetical protein